jgi:hypothetical protein
MTELERGKAPFASDPPAQAKSAGVAVPLQLERPARAVG